MAADNPLTNADYTKLNTALARIINTEEQLKKGQECGLDMAEPMAQLQAQKYIIDQLKKQFFPDRQ